MEERGRRKGSTSKGFISVCRWTSVYLIIRRHGEIVWVNWRRRLMSPFNRKSRSAPHFSFQCNQVSHRCLDIVYFTCRRWGSCRTRWETLCSTLRLRRRLQTPQKRQDRSDIRDQEGWVSAIYLPHCSVTSFLCAGEHYLASFLGLVIRYLQYEIRAEGLGSFITNFVLPATNVQDLRRRLSTTSIQLMASSRLGWGCCLSPVKTDALRFLLFLRRSRRGKW